MADDTVFTTAIEHKREHNRRLWAQHGVRYRANAAARRAENLDEHLQKRREKYAEKKDVINARRRANRAQDPWRYRQLERQAYENDPSRKKEQSRKYRERYPEKKREQMARWLARRHIDERRAYARALQKKLRANPNFRIAASLRSRLGAALRGKQKGGSVICDLGCSIPEFRAYIEAQFAPEMSWENWGRYGWHLDHIHPLAQFDLADPAQFRIAVHFSNYQPLWAKDNLVKNKRIL